MITVRLQVDDNGDEFEVEFRDPDRATAVLSGEVMEGSAATLRKLLCKAHEAAWGAYDLGGQLHAAEGSSAQLDAIDRQAGRV